MAGGRGAQMCSSTALGAHTSSASMSEEEKVAARAEIQSVDKQAARERMRARAAERQRAIEEAKGKYKDGAAQSVVRSL